MPLSGPSKIGYDSGGAYKDVTPNVGLPIQSAGPAVIVQQFTTNTRGATIDTLGYSWVTVQMTAGYTGMTGLTATINNDGGGSWFNLALANTSSTSSGITTSLGTSATMWHGPLPARYLSFIPSTAGSSGTMTLTIYLSSIPLAFNTVGTNTSLTNAGVGTIMGTGGITVGTASGQAFQRRQTGSATQAATAIVAAATGVFAFVTDIFWTTPGASPTNDLTLTLAASATPDPTTPVAGGHTILTKGGTSDERHFRNPWKISTANNTALNLTVAGTVSGTWEVIVDGYFST